MEIKPIMRIPSFVQVENARSSFQFRCSAGDSTFWISASHSAARFKEVEILVYTVAGFRRPLEDSHAGPNRDTASQGSRGEDTQRVRQ